MRRITDYDYRELRGRIKARIGTEGEFARKINRSHNYIVKVFKNESDLSQKDILKASEVLDIETDDIGKFFFTKKVHKNGTEESET